MKCHWNPGNDHGGYMRWRWGVMGGGKVTITCYKKQKVMTQNSLTPALLKWTPRYYYPS